MKSFIANQADEDVAIAMKYYQHEMNKFLFHQFAMNQWKQQDKCTSQTKFAQMLFDNVDKKKMRIFRQQQYFNLLSDDVSIYILSFLCDDDKLIHTSLILLNKQWNNIVQKNYHSFNYIPNYNMCRRLPLARWLQMAGTMIDYRLEDGYWISNVYVRDTPYIDYNGDSNRKRMNLLLDGVPQIQLKDQMSTSQLKLGLSFLSRLILWNDIRISKMLCPQNWALHGSMTQRPVIVQNDSNYLNRNVFKYTRVMCVDARITSHCYLYPRNKNGNAQYHEFRQVFGNYSWNWICSMIDKSKQIASNGQICLLIDLRNDETFSQMSDKQYYEIMESKQYYNVHPISMCPEMNKNEFNTLNQEYMFEYWVHIDNWKEIAPFGSNNITVEEQNKMHKLLYSMYNLNNQQFSGNKMLQYEKFESLSYNGKYIIDSINWDNNSCTNNELIKIIHNKTICHKYCESINENELIKQVEYVNQRPILSFDLTKLFDKNAFYNKKHGWKLMVLVRPKYLFVKHPDLKWIRLFDNDDEWYCGQLLTIWEDMNDSNTSLIKKRSEMLTALTKWRGQCKIKIDITKPLMAKLNQSKPALDMMTAEMEEITLIESEASNLSRKKATPFIFYDYFAHLDDTSQIKPFQSTTFEPFGKIVNYFLSHIG